MGAPVSLFRTIQDTLSTYRVRSVIVTILRTWCKTEGDTSMSTCWACGGAPPSWSFVCEECGGRGVSSKSAQEQMEMAERDYWRAQWGNTAIHFVADRLSLASLPQQSLIQSYFVVNRRTLKYFRQALGRYKSPHRAVFAPWRCRRRITERTPGRLGILPTSSWDRMGEAAPALSAASLLPPPEYRAIAVTYPPLTAHALPGSRRQLFYRA